MNKDNWSTVEQRNVEIGISFLTGEYDLIRGDIYKRVSVGTWQIMPLADLIKEVFMYGYNLKERQCSSNTQKKVD